MDHIISKLHERLELYLTMINDGIIEYTPFIIEVGALTVGTDETGKIIAQNVVYPTQFSRNAVETILSMNWKDGNGQNITPTVFSRSEWYKCQIKSINETLNLMQ